MLPLSTYVETRATSSMVVTPAIARANPTRRTDGMPRNPGAWLLTVARRRAVDRLRRAARIEQDETILNELATEDDDD